MKTLFLSVMVASVVLCFDVNAQCVGGSCGRPVVRAAGVVRSVVVRPLRRGLFVLRGR